MSDDFKKVTEAFEQAVISLRKDVEYLANHSNVSDKFIDRKNRVLLHLINYQKHIENYIDELHQENRQMRTHITSLKAICVIHRVEDYPIYLLRGKPLLVMMANELQEEEKFRLPYMMKQKLEKLPLKERAGIESILFKDTDQELQELLIRIKKRKNRFIYGIGTQRNQKKEGQEREPIRSKSTTS